MKQQHFTQRRMLKRILRRLSVLLHRWLQRPRYFCRTPPLLVGLLPLLLLLVLLELLLLRMLLLCTPKLFALVT